MLQGTASSVGKSVLVTALCRIFADQGIRVAPFKAQNMSNNSFATPDGLEIGRAQAEQARAARVAPDVRMNPVLLKPEGDMTSQVVLMGKPAGSLRASYFNRKADLWTHVRTALDSLREDHDLVVIEGAGSPAEINLRRGDIVNMRVARYAQAPVLLIGDIDNGGVFAHLVGTLALVTAADRRLVRGLIINKFRGDYALLEPGIAMLEKRARKPVVGVVRYMHDLRVAEEDAVALDRSRTVTRAGADQVRIVVVRLPHISNFDDFDPLAAEPTIALSYVTSPAGLAGADLIIIPGTKNTRRDLRWLRERGLDAAIRDARGRGAGVIGICGGLQMLGTAISDPAGVEGAAGNERGLGLLEAHTIFQPEKTTVQVRASVAAGHGIFDGLRDQSVEGYEIHMGVTSSKAGHAFDIGADRRPDGVVSEDGRVWGTYLHGLFANDAFRAGLLRNAGRGAAAGTVAWDPEAHIDRLARHVSQCLDIDRIKAIAGF
jgi:adenosylcobyric acid synthase